MPLPIEDFMCSSREYITHMNWFISLTFNRNDRVSKAMTSTMLHLDTRNRFKMFSNKINLLL